MIIHRCDRFTIASRVKSEGWQAPILSLISPVHRRRRIIRCIHDRRHASRSDHHDNMQQDRRGVLHMPRNARTQPTCPDATMHASNARFMFEAMACREMYHYMSSVQGGQQSHKHKNCTVTSNNRPGCEAHMQQQSYTVFF